MSLELFEEIIENGRKRQKQRNHPPAARFDYLMKNDKVRQTDRQKDRQTEGQTDRLKFWNFK